MKILNPKQLKFIPVFLCLLLTSCHEDVDTNFPVQHNFTRIPKENVINLVFTGNLDPESASSLQNYNFTPSTKDESITITKITTKRNEVFITLSKPMIQGRQYTVEVQNLQALKGGDIIHKIPVVDYDGVDKFELTSTNFNSSKEVLVSFSSKIDSTTIQKSDFKIISSQNKELAISKITLGQFKTNLTLTLETPLTLGKNTITISNISGLNKVGLTKTSSTLKFEKFDETKWLKFVDIPLSTNDMEKQMKFDFDEDRLYTSDPPEYEKLDIIFWTFSKGITIKAKGLFVVNKPIEDVKDVAFYTDKLYRETRIDDRIRDRPFFDSYNGGAYYRPWCQHEVDDIFSYNRYLRGDHIDLKKPLKIIPNQTIVFRTTKGLYGKLEVISLYKDKPKEHSYSNYTYYITLRVLVQKDGSTNLDIPYNL